MDLTGLQNYLKAQMQIVATLPPVAPPIVTEPITGHEGDKIIDKEGPLPEPPKATPVAPVELPPEVIKFQPEDLEDLTLCCQQVDLSPRSVKRLVNVFKLVKIFWFRSMGGDHPRPAKQAVMSLLALSAAYPEIMREAFVRLEMWLRDAEPAEKQVFEELLKINLDATFEKTFALKLKFFKRDIEAFRARNFGNVSLSILDVSSFNLIRSFSFVGDPNYWADREPNAVT
jgi:hypothetical protein